MSAAAALLLLSVAFLAWPHRGRLGRGRTRGSSINLWTRIKTMPLPKEGGRWILGAATICATVVALFAPWHAAICVGALSAVAGASWAQAHARRLQVVSLARDVETLQAIAAELRAGNDLARSLRSAGTVADTPMCTAIIRAAHAIGMGDDPAASLERTGVPGVDQLAGLVRLSGSRGIALADAVEMLASDAAERANARRDVTSLLAGPRATAAMLTLLPLFGIVMGQTIGADPWRVLLHTSAGAIAMIAGTALAAAGVLWTSAMVSGAQ